MDYRTIKKPALSASFSIDDVEVFARTLRGPSAAVATHKIVQSGSGSFARHGPHAKKAARIMHGLARKASARRCKR